MPESNTRRYEREKGSALYRRSLYTFWKRSAPPALLDLFNAPSRETCTVRRERTNTPLQALATLNDPQFLEAARTLAARALDASRGNAEGAFDFIARRVLARPLREAETAEVAASFREMSRFYEETPAEAERLLSIGEAPTPAAAGQTTQLAALTLVANQLLNLDEALNK